MDDTQRTGWQKRILLFLTSQCITLFGSTLVQMALVWYATMQTSSGVWVAAFTVCSYLPQFSHFIYRRRMGRPIPQEKIDYRRRSADCICHFRNGIGNSAYFIGACFARRLLVMSVIRSLGAGIQTPAVNAVIPQLARKISLCGTTASMQQCSLLLILRLQRRQVQFLQSAH